MFNREYQFDFNQLAELFRFSHGDNVACEVPQTEQWLHAFSPFWRIITTKTTNSYEGNTTTSIHNPALRYVRQVLACTIFCCANSSKVNSKEFFYLFAILNQQKINHVPFMFAHMRTIANVKRGAITLGGLITTLTCIIGLEDRIQNLESLPPEFIDLDMAKSMHLVKERYDDRFYLMINNQVFPSIILPDPNKMDICNHANLCYEDPTVPSQAPTHIRGNVAAGGGTTFVPPAQIFSNHFAGSSSSSRQNSVMIFLMRCAPKMKSAMASLMPCINNKRT
jgi:hypothetical protein